MTWPPPNELAILTVNGQNYQEWETVMVKHSLVQTPFYTFRMTCSEGMPLVQNLRNLQIVPGDKCTITLANELAFTGLVFSRQVFYDHSRHYIEIQGAADVLLLSYASVVTKGMQFTKKNAHQIITDLVKPFKIPFKVEGGQLPTTEIPRLNIAPGTTVMDAVEQVLRQVGSAQLTSDIASSLVAVIDPTGGGDTVTEGVDILEGRELIYNPAMAQGTYSSGQKPPEEDENASKGAHEPHEKSNVASSIQQPVKQQIINELPAWGKEFLTNRANMDRDFQNRDQVTVHATLYGWLRKSGGLWQRNQTVSVISPMLVMSGSEKLRCKSATFTQDNNTGTRTVLELCNDLGMGSVPQTGGKP
jgi:prophage tail gpP-like protein